MAAPIADRVTHARRDTVIAWVFVGVQFLLLGMMVFFPRDATWSPSSLMRAIGLVFMSAGVLVGLWSALYLGRGLTPSPLPNGASKLVTHGPYRFVRHPIYTSVMLLGVGIAIRSGSWIVTVALVGLVLLFSVKARWEEMHLADTFPGYSNYMKATGRFVPKPAR